MSASDLMSLMQAPAKSKSGQGGKPLEIPIRQIKRDSKQPRQEFDEQELQQLANSIEREGILEPITVREVGPNSYQIVFGERRWRAAQLAHLKTVPCLLSTKRSTAAQVIENLHRAALSHDEMAGWVEQQLAAGRTQAELARQLAVAESVISDYAKLIRAPECVKEAFREGRCRDLTAIAALVRAHKTAPKRVESLTKQSGTITRQAANELLATASQKPATPSARSGKQMEKNTTGQKNGEAVLHAATISVTVAGKAGQLLLSHTSRKSRKDTEGWVRFGKTVKAVPLAKIQLVTITES